VPGITCPSCGALNAADDSFCSKCGTTLRAATPPPALTHPSTPAGYGASPGRAGAPPPPPGWGPPGWGPHPPIPSAPAGTPIKPTTAFVLAVVGGVLILLSSLLELSLVVALTQVGAGPTIPPFWITGIIGLVVGLLLIVCGVLLYFQPQHHVVYGVFILVFAVVSLVSFGGGFLVGFVLALVAGVLAIAHRTEPLPPPFYYYAPPPFLPRLCLRCRSPVDPTVRFCPHCGNPLG
jgi:hypothetical protein